MVRRQKTSKKKVCSSRKTCKIMKGGDSITGENTVGTKLIDFSGRVASSVVGAADKVLGPALDNASDAIFGDMTEKPFSEVAPQLTKEIKENATFIKNAASDPNVRAALKEYGQALGEAVDIASKIAKPVVDKAVNDTLDALNEAGEKAAVGTVNTGLNLFKAAVAEIPLVGAAVDLGLAGAQAMNYTAQAASPLIISSTKTMANAMESIDDANPEINAIKEKMGKATSLLTNAVSSVKDKSGYIIETTKPDSNAIKEKMGKATSNLTMSYKDNKTLGKTIRTATSTIKVGGRRKARSTTRRILHSLRNFTQKRK